MNISSAKPTSDRPRSSGSFGSIHPKPLRPMTRPAAIWPTTTGGPNRPSEARSGPTRPAATTSVSAPNPMAQHYDPRPMAKVRWKPDPEDHDYPAATDYLELLVPPSMAEAITDELRRAPTITKHSKDLLRAARLEALDGNNPHVASDLRKIRDKEPLSPVLLVRGDAGDDRALIVADGYHRICAVHVLDENAEIPCRMADLPS